MLINPTIMVSKIKVFKGSGVAFEAIFHKGINVIRGKNSSGKTTIIDFMAYCLGSELIPWKPQALACTEVTLELLLNDVVVTISRKVSIKPQESLSIYYGDIESALAAPRHSWQQYPFKRSADKLSFTQAILLALGLPEASGDGASNLTMHQFMRVIYADQPSLHSPIFRNDTFDSELTRRTVGDYLCGVYHDDLYASQLELRSCHKELSKLEAELDGIFKVIRKSGQPVDMERISDLIQAAENELAASIKELERLKEERSISASELKNNDSNLRLQLDSSRAELQKKLNRITSLVLEIEDSNLFIGEINRRLASIDEAKAIRSHLNTLQFSFCPACLSPIHNDDDSCCSLCKSGISSEQTGMQILRMKNELAIQLSESNSLLNKSMAELSELRRDIRIIKSDLTKLELIHASSSMFWSSDVEVAMEKAARLQGYLEQKISSLRDSQRLASVIQEIYLSRDVVNKRITDLRSKIEIYELEQARRCIETHEEISSSLKRLLMLDLPRQAEFENAKDVQISFSDNKITVNGASKFSESSTVILRHLFHLALLISADKLKYMRMPRLIILDGIEDGGLETIRAHNLQNIISSECGKLKNDFQVILATSQIAPSLDIEPYLIGRSFSKEDRSLMIKNVL